MNLIEQTTFTIMLKEKKNKTPLGKWPIHFANTSPQEMSNQKRNSLWWEMHWHASEQQLETLVQKWRENILR